MKIRTSVVVLLMVMMVLTFFAVFRIASRVAFDDTSRPIRAVKLGAPSVILTSTTVFVTANVRSDASSNSIISTHDPLGRIIKSVQVIIPDALQDVIHEGIGGLTPRQDYRRRIAGIRRLGRNLSADDVKALMGFVCPALGDLAPWREKSDRLDPQLLVAVDNEIMDLLLDQEPLPPGIGDWLLGIAKASSDSAFASLRENLVLRDYAIQHLVPYVEREFAGEQMRDGASRLQGEVNMQTDASERPPYLQSWQTFQKEYVALTKDNTTLGATALLGLSYLADHYQGVDTEPVIARAQEVAGSTEFSDTVRVTAVQVLARLGDTNSLLAIRSLASGHPCSSVPSVVTIEDQTARRDAEPYPISIHLQMSAIAALGTVGDAQDIVFIKSLTNGVAGIDPRIIPAAQSALFRLETHPTGG